jgi:hypothetical protein
MKIATIALVLFVMALSATAHAMPSGIDEAVLKEYTPAIWHHGLETAYEQPDPSKLHSFVVVERGGIPVERARFYITWGEYDYRGAVVHVGKGQSITSRRGSPYAYLQRGDVMAVAGIKYFNRTVYLKLISADVYIPEKRKFDKRHSRVTVMLGFDFPKDVIGKDDAEGVIATLNAWIKPFPNLPAAQAYASGLQIAKPVVAEEPAAVSGGDTAAAANTAAAPAASAGADVQDEKMRSLEEKIEKARRDLDEAEHELKTMKKTR